LSVFKHSYAIYNVSLLKQLFHIWRIVYYSEHLKLL
jgi:hypothetical protein